MQDVEQLRGAHRFHELGVDARHWNVGLSGGCEQNHNQLFQPFVRADFARHGPAIHPRHHHVDDRDVETVVAARGFLHLAQRFGAALEAPLAQAPRLQVALENRAVGAVVVDHGHEGAGEADRR